MLREFEGLAPRAGRPGCPPLFSDAAVQVCLMGKVLFDLLLQQTTGMAARKDGTHRRRQYRKVYLAMVTVTVDIRAVEFTSSSEGDSPVLPELLNQIPRMRKLRPSRTQVSSICGTATAVFESRRSGDHTCPQKRPAVEGGLSSRQSAQR